MQFPSSSLFSALTDAIYTIFSCLQNNKDEDFPALSSVLRLKSPGSVKHISFAQYEEHLKKGFDPNSLDYGCRTADEVKDFVDHVPRLVLFSALTFFHLSLEKDEAPHDLTFIIDEKQGSFLEHTFVFKLFDETTRVLARYALKKNVDTDDVYLRILVFMWNVAFHTEHLLIKNLVRSSYLWQPILSLDYFFLQDEGISGFCYLLLKQDMIRTATVPLSVTLENLDSSCIQKFNQDGLFVHGLSYPILLTSALVETLKFSDTKLKLFASSNQADNIGTPSFLDQASHGKLPFGEEIYQAYLQVWK